MKVMSIIGIVLFSWLFFNRCAQYTAVVNFAGKSITYTDAVVEKSKNGIAPQIAVSIYALVYSVFGTVYFFKRVSSKNGDVVNVLKGLFELKEKGAITIDEYEKEKSKIIGNTI